MTLPRVDRLATMSAEHYRQSWDPSEADFQAEVLAAAHQLGWMSWYE